MGITAILIILIILSINTHSQKSKEFYEFKESFEILNNYFISSYEANGINIEKIRYSFSKEPNGRVEKIYCGNTHNYVPLKEEVVNAFLKVHNAFVYDFSYISVSTNRISYGGIGNEMYVYSRDKKTPKYFLKEDEKTSFSCESLGDDWYYLYLNTR